VFRTLSYSKFDIGHALDTRADMNIDMIVS